MAERYGGKYSPGQTPQNAAPKRGPWQGRRRSRAGGRVNMLFLAPLPLAIRAFTQDPSGLALNLAGFAVLMLSAWLTREGVQAQDAYDARRIARRPAFPRKLAGSVLTGLGLFIASLAASDSLLNPLIFAGLGFALHAFSFGLDPMRDKGIEGVDTFQQDRVARAVSEAEKHLAAIRAAIKNTGDRQLQARIERFEATAREMFRTVEEDPRDLTAARKYLGVYLLGARDATAKFAEIYARSRDPQARADYEALLDDLERNFAAKTETFLLDNKTDLNIEIEVLRERLEREGVRAHEYDEEPAQ